VRPPARLLVVEDDPDVRIAMAEALSELGYEVGLAANGVEAFEQLRSGPRPGLILLDLMMPIMDGWTFLGLQRLDPELAAIPVVILSASVPPGTSVSDLAAQALLEKPFGLDRLVETLGRVPAQAPA
jgi:CheY-like chemotaxis protein